MCLSLMNMLGFSSSLLRNSSDMLIIFRHEPHRKHRFRCYSPIICRPLQRSLCLFIRLLHNNGCTRPFQGLCPAKGLYATLYTTQTKLEKQFGRMIAEGISEGILEYKLVGRRDVGTSWTDEMNMWIRKELDYLDRVAKKKKTNRQHY
jgi:hypothetical protein